MSSSETVSATKRAREVLRKHRPPLPRRAKAAPLKLEHARHDGQEGRLPAAVPAHQRVDAAAARLDIQVAQHPSRNHARSETTPAPTRRQARRASRPARPHRAPPGRGRPSACPGQRPTASRPESSRRALRPPRHRARRRCGRRRKAPRGGAWRRGLPRRAQAAVDKLEGAGRVVDHRAGGHASPPRRCTPARGSRERARAGSSSRQWGRAGPSARRAAAAAAA